MWCFPHSFLHYAKACLSTAATVGFLPRGRPQADANPEKDFDNIDQKTKDGHDWAARVIVGHGKKIGSKLVSLAHSSFLEESFLQQSPWTKGSRDYVISNDKSGEWHTRKINVKKLLEKTHGISFTNFIAIFSDSNNSKQKITILFH